MRISERYNVFLSLIVIATLFCFARIISTRFPLSVQIRQYIFSSFEIN